MLHRLLPDDGEVAGLLALMLLTDARRPARTTADGELVPLDEQDRTRWDPAAIAEGVALVTDALSRTRLGPYQLQAAIAAVHDEAPRGRGHRLAADPRALRPAGGHDRQPDGHAQPGRRRRDGARSAAPGSRCSTRSTGDERIARHHRLDAVRAHLLEHGRRPRQRPPAYRAAATPDDQRARAALPAVPGRRGWPATARDGPGLLHVDIDQFLAAVEILRRPELRGRPVVVGGDGDPTAGARQVVDLRLVRGAGVRCPLRNAAAPGRRRCPDAVFLPTDPAPTTRRPREVMAVLRRSRCPSRCGGGTRRSSARPSTIRKALAHDGPAGGARGDRSDLLDRASATTSTRAKLATGFAKPAGMYRLDRRTTGWPLMGRPADR